MASRLISLSLGVDCPHSVEAKAATCRNVTVSNLLASSWTSLWYGPNILYSLSRRAWSIVCSAWCNLQFTLNWLSAFALAMSPATFAYVTVEPGLTCLAGYGSAVYSAYSTYVRARYGCPYVRLRCGRDCAHSLRCSQDRRRNARFGGFPAVAAKGFGGKPALLVS